MSESISTDYYRARSSGHETAPQARENEILDQLPAQCRIDGYWETLASNSDNWAHEVTAAPIWRGANVELEKWRKEYRRQHGEELIKNAELPRFIGKSAFRIKEKLFAKIAKSDDREKETARLFSQDAPIPKLEDLVRVRLETKFLDGVPFLAKKILELALAVDVNATLEPKGKLSGYFAQHVTFEAPVFFRFAGGSMAGTVVCEVQVATSLGTLVWENSHGLYERSRILDERSEEWQWSPSDPRFLARQLGHMIHLADGLFCNLRDHGKNRGGK